MVLVCARREGCAWPETGARDQYMPEEGAGGTSGEVVGEARGGKAVYFEDEADRDEVVVVLVELRWVVDREAAVLEAERSAMALVVAEVVMALDEPGLLAMADVERRAVGRRAELSSLDSGRCRCPSAGESPFSRADVFRRLTGGPFGERVGAEEGDTAVAAEIALCLIVRSDVEAFLLEVWLLVAKWPGVWLRGIGGIVSVEMSVGKSCFENETDALGASVDGEVDAAIFCERMVFVRSGDACRSSLGLAGWSAMSAVCAGSIICMYLEAALGSCQLGTRAMRSEWVVECDGAVGVYRSVQRVCRK